MKSGNFIAKYKYKDKSTVVLKCYVPNVYLLEALRPSKNVHVNRISLFPNENETYCTSIYK